MLSAKYVIVAFVCVAVTMVMAAKEKLDSDAPEVRDKENNKVEVCIRNSTTKLRKCFNGTQENNGNKTGNAREWSANYTDGTDDFGPVPFNDNPPETNLDPDVCPTNTSSDGDNCCATCHYKKLIPPFFQEAGKYEGEKCYVSSINDYYFSRYPMHGLCRESNTQCGESGVDPKKGDGLYRSQCTQLYAVQPLRCRYCVAKTCRYWSWWWGWNSYHCYSCYYSSGDYKYPYKCACKTVKIAPGNSDKN